MEEKKTQDEEEKLFSYSELLAMAWLIAGHSCYITCAKEFNDPIEGREMIGKMIHEILDIRWKK